LNLEVEVNFEVDFKVEVEPQPLRTLGLKLRCIWLHYMYMLPLIVAALKYIYLQVKGDNIKYDILIAV